jgi:hypothetical protein
VFEGIPLPAISQLPTTYSAESSISAQSSTYSARFGTPLLSGEPQNKIDAESRRVKAQSEFLLCLHKIDLVG